MVFGKFRKWMEGVTVRWQRLKQNLQRGFRLLFLVTVIILCLVEISLLVVTWHINHSLNSDLFKSEVILVGPAGQISCRTRGASSRQFFHILTFPPAIFKQTGNEIAILLCLQFVIAASEVASKLSFPYLTTLWFLVSFDTIWAISQVVRSLIIRGELLKAEESGCSTGRILTDLTRQMVVQFVRLGISLVFFGVLAVFSMKARRNTPRLPWLLVLGNSAECILSIGVLPWLALCYLWVNQVGLKPVVVCTLTLLVFWVRMGYFAQRCTRVDFFLFTISTLILNVFWASQFIGAEFLHTFKKWPFFTSAWLISELMTLTAFISCVIRRRKQSKGGWDSIGEAASDKALPSSERQLSGGNDSESQQSGATQPSVLLTVPESSSTEILESTEWRSMSESDHRSNPFTEPNERRRMNESVHRNSMYDSASVTNSSNSDSDSQSTNENPFVDPIASPLPPFDSSITVDGSYSSTHNNLPAPAQRQHAPPQPSGAADSASFQHDIVFLNLMSATRVGGGTLSRSSFISNPPSYSASPRSVIRPPLPPIPTPADNDLALMRRITSSSTRTYETLPSYRFSATSTAYS